MAISVPPHPPRQHPTACISPGDTTAFRLGPQDEHPLASAQYSPVIYTGESTHPEKLAERLVSPRRSASHLLTRNAPETADNQPACTTPRALPGLASALRAPRTGLPTFSWRRLTNKTMNSSPPRPLLHHCFPPGGGRLLPAHSQPKRCRAGTAEGSRR